MGFKARPAWGPTGWATGLRYTKGPARWLVNRLSGPPRAGPWALLLRTGRPGPARWRSLITAHPTKVFANTYSRENTSWKAKSSTFLIDSIVKFSNSSTNLDPRSAICHIYTDGSKIYEIKNEKWGIRNIRKALIVMTPAPNSNLHAMFSWTINGYLNMGFIQWCNND